jgi:phenylpropionate dioxygenase-like ring-hydroxylating dioxygenase large terminal subunit
MSTDLKEQVETRLNQGLLGMWYIVAKAADVVAGKPYFAQAMNRNLVLWRDSAGEVRCVEDYCPHRGAPLSHGRVAGDHIACRYHGVQIDGNGVIALVPAMEGCALEGRKAVDAYVVREFADAVFAYFPSVSRPEPDPFSLPVELTDEDRFSHFLATGLWDCNYRYALDNLADPMHGCYLHADSFTLSAGIKQDLVRLDKVETGFSVSREGQQGINFDWAELTTSSVLYARVDIPYPISAGPGGILRIVAFVTPVDETHARIFFWRIREVSNLARESWRFMFRAIFEERHWHVLEQDREMLSALPAHARRREMLYQHDIGVTHIRRWLAREARAQVEAEIEAGLHAQADARTPAGEHASS